MERVEGNKRDYVDLLGVIGKNHREGKHRENVEKILSTGVLEEKFLGSPMDKWELLDRLLIAAGHSSDEVLSIKVGKVILQEARMSPEFHQALSKHYERLHYNMREISKTSPDHPRKIAFCAGAESIWDPSHPPSLGGYTEGQKSLIGLTAEMVTRGYQVRVFANPPKDSLWSLPVSNPQFVSTEEWGTDSEKYEAILMWQRTDFSTGTRKSSKVLWVPQGNKGSKVDSTGLTGVIYLSEEQKKNYLTENPHLSEIPFLIGGRGYRLEIPTGEAALINPYSCAYTSRYDEGLEVVLDMWPTVRKNFPHAILNIYHARQDCPPEKLEGLVGKISRLNKRGVIEYGIVPDTKLASQLAKNSLFLSLGPFVSEKESSTSLLWAQAVGCLPVTSQEGGLKQLISPTAYSVPEVTTTEGKNKYRDLLLLVLGKIKESENNLEVERNLVKEFPKGQQWSVLVDKWLSFVEGK